MVKRSGDATSPDSLAAASAITYPTGHNFDPFGAFVQQRTRCPAHRFLTDEPDLVAVAARLRLAPPQRLTPQIVFEALLEQLDFDLFEPNGASWTAASASPQGALSQRAQAALVHEDPGGAAHRGQPAFAGLAVEDRGRVVNATMEAAGFYRQAQQATGYGLETGCDGAPVGSRSRSALRARRGRSQGIRGSPLGPITGRQMSWGPHHIQVVRSAAAGKFTRAADLLGEHLVSVGCDPLALRPVTDLQRRSGQAGLEHLAGQLPKCQSALTPSFP
jgi:hypothetical protein